jgi:hypothetical protein
MVSQAQSQVSQKKLLQRLLRGLILALAIAAFLGNLSIIMQVGLYLLGIHFLNRDEDEKKTRIIHVIGCGLFAFLGAFFFGNFPVIGETVRHMPEYWIFWAPAAYHLIVDLRRGLLQGRQSQNSIGSIAIGIATGAILLGLLFLAMLNANPWIEAVRIIVGQLFQESLFFAFLGTIPIIGSVFQMGLVNSISFIVGIVFWALCQSVQLMPIFLAYDVALQEKLRSATRGAKGEIIKNALKMMGLIRSCAYVFEILVVFTSIPPYQGGWAAIFGDAPNWDPDLVNWVNLLVVTPLTVCAVEGLVKAAIVLFTVRSATEEAAD